MNFSVFDSTQPFDFLTLYLRLSQKLTRLNFLIKKVENKQKAISLSTPHKQDFYLFFLSLKPNSEETDEKGYNRTRRKCLPF